jgi:ribosomal protein S18 acetylase RimI-like enzyme
MERIQEISIRKYESDDYDQLINIAKALPEWFTKNGIGKMEIDLRYQTGFVALSGSEIVGFLSFFTIEGEGQIGWLGVNPEFHRKGIGRTLLNKVISELKEAGIKTLQVYTLGDSVDYEPYTRTRAFYRSVGFKDFKCFETDDPECPEQLILKMNI